MKLTVYFPASDSWRDAERWIYEHRLPVTMLSVPAAPAFQGRTFSRFCTELDYHRFGFDDLGQPVYRLIYHNPRVKFRRR